MKRPHPLLPSGGESYKKQTDDTILVALNTRSVNQNEVIPGCRHISEIIPAALALIPLPKRKEAA